MTRSQAHLITAMVLATGQVALHAAEFSFDQLCEASRKVAAAPYTPAKQELADYWKNLTYDQHRDIRFKMDSGLWAKEKLPFSIDFFHPGWTAKKMVTLHEVTDGQSTPLKFDPALFDYGKQKVPAGTPPPPGYAGWRARCHSNSQDYMDEFLVFLGASYLRAIPANSPYGLSARGLSINSGLPGVIEEFPDFTTFYLQRPTKDAKELKAWALLDGESAAGAYQFTITPGAETVMDIEAELTLRRPLEHTHHQFRHCVFTMEKPRSWALVQRDRRFSSYQDPEARYHERPSVRVEPVAGFDYGKIHLIEMPTIDETNDNVILVWEPQPALEVGKPFRFHYRLRWMRDPAPSGMFAVRSTRLGTPVQKPDQLLIAVDFAKPLQPQPKIGDPKWDDISGLKPVVTLNQQSAKLLHVGLSDVSMPNVDDLPAGLGRSPSLHMPQVLRAFFVIDPPKDLNQIDMTCELQDASGKAVSERWVYLWMRPNP